MESVNQLINLNLTFNEKNMILFDIIIIGNYFLKYRESSNQALVMIMITLLFQNTAINFISKCTRSVNEWNDPSNDGCQQN